MPIFIEIATLHQTQEPFAVVRIDTDKRIDGGCEAIILSTHETREAAQSAAALTKEMNSHARH